MSSLSPKKAGSGILEKYRPPAIVKIGSKKFAPILKKKLVSVP
jgi:hypothetical protein